MRRLPAPEGVRCRRGVALARADGALQVGAGAEGAFPGSREDGHVHVEVVGDGIEDPHDVPVGGQGVDGWVVERDNGDVVLDVDVDGHGRAPCWGWGLGPFGRRP